MMDLLDNWSNTDIYENYISERSNDFSLRLLMSFWDSFVFCFIEMLKICRREYTPGKCLDKSAILAKSWKNPVWDILQVVWQK